MTDAPAPKTTPSVLPSQSLGAPMPPGVMPARVDPRDAEIANLRADVERLTRMRDEDDQYMVRMAQARRIEIENLRRELANARSSHDLQQKATLAFREDYLREKARADGLEKEMPHG